MTKQQFMANAEALSKEAQAPEGFYGYFRIHASRLYRSCQLFNLFGPLGDVLEIGPFYGCTPFTLRQYSSSYTVLEGDDPGIYWLETLYKRFSIALAYVDLFELFGPVRSAPHKLPASDSAYDTILCWETIEHFNFNPVKFIRELHRVLKPGGRVCITVPNKASYQNIFAFLTGRQDKKLINDFLTIENAELNGKKVFYGFHWREYSPQELSYLFASIGFKVQACSSFTEFQNYGKVGICRKIARVMSQTGSSLLPRYGTHVYLTATK